MIIDKNRELVRFDWAMKRVLRDKANFTVLEGFLTSLLGRPIKIIQILESEGNKEFDENKSNRVDLLALEGTGSKVLIEVQNETEESYFHQMLFATSKIINDFLKSGEGYENITKVYSINIVYFKLGEGGDYVYHGKTEFRGLHDHKPMVLPKRFREKFKVEEVGQIYPEYYILQVKDFNKVAKTPLDQWMYFLRHSELPENAEAPGLKEADEKLRISRLSSSERASYFHYIDSKLSLDDAYNSAYNKGIYEGRNKGIEEGRAEGIEEGREEGRAEGRDIVRREIVARMRTQGLDDETIAKLTGIELGELETKYRK